MTSGSDKPRRLGRGLEALLATRPAAAASPSSAPSAAAGSESAGAAPYRDVPAEPAPPSELQRIGMSSIRPNPFQPRKEFDPAELAELETSLRENGLIQPITVRRAPTGNGYELIAGERRFRAAQRLGWTEIPALVKDLDDRMAATLALVENLQRTDLNPIEEAEGYQRLIDDFSLTQQQVADVVGKDRSTVANILRVLNLPAAVRRMLQEGELTQGHARALLALGNEMRIVEVAREVVARGLTVRDVEKRARDAVPERRKAPATTGANAAPGGPTATTSASRDPEARRIEDDLRRYLQTDVHISVSAKERGEIRIMFYSNDDLERLLELVLGGSGDTR